MNTKTHLSEGKKAPPYWGRVDRLHASLGGLLGLSVVIHLLAAFIFINFVDFPESETPPKVEPIIHHVTLKPKAAEIKQPPQHEQKIVEAKKVTKKPVEPTSNSEANKPKKEIDKITTMPEAFFNELGGTKPDKSAAATTHDTKTEKKVAKNKKAHEKSKYKEAPDNTEKIEGVGVYDGKAAKKGAETTKEEKEERKRIALGIKVIYETNFERILSLWVKPKEYIVKRSGVIKLRLNERGDIVSAHISKSSGDLPLDYSVLEAVKRTKRFVIPYEQNIPPNYYRNIKLDFDSDM